MFDAQFVQHIDWHRTVGLQLGMINGNEPPGRNVFYDRMLGDHVRGRCCIEIGFGTGLLSMLAIKHGAEHIEAWEQDRDTFELGRYIINKLGLTHRISLHHGRFNAAWLENRDQVVFHEIIGNRIWNEGIRQALPLAAETLLPPAVTCEFDVLYVDRDQAKKIFFPERIFSPGVETVPGFDSQLQQILDATPYYGYRYQDAVDRLSPIRQHHRWDFYHVDFQLRTINSQSFEAIPADWQQTYEINIKDDEIALLYPRNTLKYQNQCLHWCWYRQPLIVDQPGIYNIEQEFDDGLFTVHSAK